MPKQPTELGAITNLQNASAFCYSVARSRVNSGLFAAALIAQRRGQELHDQSVNRLTAFYAAQEVAKISEIGL